MMLKARMDTPRANAAVQNGTMPKLLESLLEQLKPEAAYFAPTWGDRSCVIVFDMRDSSQVAAIAEPLFEEFDAKVEFTPVMNLDDLRTAMSSFGNR